MNETVLTLAPALGTSILDALAGATRDPDLVTLLVGLCGSLASGLWYVLRKYIIATAIGPAVAAGVEALAPLVQDAKDAAADGKLTREECEHFRERAAFYGKQALHVALRALLLVGESTLHALVEHHVEARKQP